MTAQTPDSIIVDGREGVLLGEPLTNLLNSLEGVPQLVARDTACWRGYVARWRVTADVLYLDDVTGWVAGYREVGASEVLPGVALPVKATWVGWTLRVGFGDQIRHVHAGYESTYEEEVLLEVAAGEVVRRESLDALDEAPRGGGPPPPPDQIRTPTTDQLRAQWPSAPQWPADAPPPMPPPPLPPPVPFDLGYVDPDGVIVPPGFPPAPPSQLATDATTDRVLIAAVDHLLSAGTTTRPSTDASSEVVVADAQAILDALEVLTMDTRLGAELFGTGVRERMVERLYSWAAAAIASIDRGAPMPTPVLPRVARPDQVARVWDETWRYEQDELASGSSFDSSLDPWAGLLAGGVEPQDLLWTAASLVTCRIHQRAEAPDEYRGTVAPVLDDLGRALAGGLLAWKHPAGAQVARPERHRLRAFFDGGSGVLLWIDLGVAEPRWYNDVDHRDLPIPMALADQLDVLLERYDETIPLREPERPLAGAEATLFKAAYREVMERLRAALGPAYAIEDRGRM